MNTPKEGLVPLAAALASMPLGSDISVPVKPRVWFPGMARPAHRKAGDKSVEGTGECATCGETIPFRIGDGLRRYCNDGCKKRRHNARGPRKMRRLACELD